MIPIRKILELDESELVLGYLREDIIQHTAISNLKLLAGEVSKDVHEWNLAHAGYLKSIHRKLTNQEFI